MRGTRYTKQENEKLLEAVNAAISLCGNYIQWSGVRTIEYRTIASMQSQWSRYLKRDCTFNGRRYVLSQSNLFDRVTPTPRVDNARKAPLNKRVKVSRSFLWGAFKFERYE